MIKAVFSTHIRRFISASAGYSLVEVLVALGVISIIVVSAVGSLVVSEESVQVGRGKTQASLLLTEYAEQVKNIKRDDWTVLANGNYIVAVVSGDIVLQSTTTGETIDEFTRMVTISDAYRDSSGALVSTPGTVDPSTKQITVTVSWTGFKQGTLTDSFYITRYLDNLSYEETTEAEFSAGTLTDVTVTNTGGGEVTLGGGGAGDWCEPSDWITAELNLPDDGSAYAIEAQEGQAFTGTGSSIVSDFFEISVSNEDPPVPTLASTIAGTDTNDVFIDGNYAYVASDNFSKDVIIIDLTTNSEVGYFNGYNGWLWKLPAEGVYVSGNVGYVTIGTRLMSFDVSSKTGSRPQMDDVFLWGTAYRLDVVGDYAFIAMDYAVSEMRLVNVSNPYSLDLGARGDVNGDEGQEIYANESGTRAYLATGSSGSLDEFFIIDTDTSTSNKNNSWYNLSIISSYNADGMDPQGVSVVPGNRAILVGTEAEEYQVIDISDENNPVRCGGTHVDAGINGIDTVLESDGDAYSYLVTKDPFNEFKIIKGGPGGQFASAGTFESQTFDAGYSSGFNRFTASSTLPIQTDITYQIAVVDPGAGGCVDADFSSFNFVGPDGTSASFFTDSDEIPVDDDGSGYENPGQCMRYRAYLTTAESTFSPVFEDIIFNYSP